MRFAPLLKFLPAAAWSILSASPVLAQLLQNGDFSGETTAPWTAGQNVFLGTPAVWNRFEEIPVAETITVNADSVTFSSADDGASDRLERFLLQEWSAVAGITAFEAGDVLRFTGRARATRTGANTGDMVVRASIRTLGWINNLSFQLKPEYSAHAPIGSDWTEFDLTITFPDLSQDDSLQRVAMGFEITGAYDGIALDTATIEFQNVEGRIDGDGGDPDPEPEPFGTIAWELVWSDEFETPGPLDPTKWQYELGGGGWGNQEIQTYTDSFNNVRVENGRLIIQAQQDFSGRTPSYTSGRVMTRDRMATQYGRIEVRAKLPGATGTWPAIWMLSNDTVLPGPFWPDNGEIDIVETVGYERDPAYLQAVGQTTVNNVHGTVHTKTRNFQTGPGGVGGSTYDPSVTEEFHVFALEWLPTELRFFIDGNNYLTLKRESDFGIPVRTRPADISPYWPFQQRFFLILNIAIGGQWGGRFNTNNYPSSPYGTTGVNANATWPQTMEVDYVRVYRIPPVSVATAPGILEPARYEREYGLRLANSTSANSTFSFVNIQSGDYVEHAVFAATAGTYQLQADYRAATASRQLVLSNLTTGGAARQITLPSTGGTWQMTDLGTVTLRQGRNVLRLQAQNDGFEMGNLALSLPAEGSRSGYPLLAGDVVDTGDWLGPLNFSLEPFVYAPRLRTWLFATSLTEAGHADGGQYFAVLDAANLKPYDGSSAPWFYSTALNQWFYLEGATSAEDVTGPRWVFIRQ